MSKFGISDAINSAASVNINKFMAEQDAANLEELVKNLDITPEI